MRFFGAPAVLRVSGGIEVVPPADVRLRQIEEEREAHIARLALLDDVALPKVCRAVVRTEESEELHREVDLIELGE